MYLWSPTNIPKQFTANLIWNRAGQREIKVANIKYSTPQIYLCCAVCYPVPTLCAKLVTSRHLVT